MKKLVGLFILMVAVILLVAVCATAKNHSHVRYDKSVHNCAVCHTLSRVEARKILSRDISTVEVLGVRQAPAKGLYEVAVDMAGRKGVVYIDYTKKLFFAGSIFDLNEHRNLTQQRVSDLNRVDVSQIPSDNTLVLGPRNAKIQVILFTDPDCPFCARQHAEIKQVLAARNDVAFVVRLMPLSIHPNALWKATTIVCAKSVQLLDDNFAGKPIEKNECITNKIDENLKLAASLGISGTPAMILPDGRVLMGLTSSDRILQELSRMLKH